MRERLIPQEYWNLLPARRCIAIADDSGFSIARRGSTRLPLIRMDSRASGIPCPWPTEGGSRKEAGRSKRWCSRRPDSVGWKQTHSCCSVSKIQWVKYAARGFRNKPNFQIAINFHCGGLEMAP